MTEPQLFVRNTKATDAEIMAPLLRSADKEEIYAISGLEPYEALTECHRNATKCYSLVESGKPIAMFGSAKFSDDLANVWLLGTKRLTCRRTWFLRSSRLWLQTLHEGNATLFAHIDARNVVHIRWLEWLGFAKARHLDMHGYEKRLFLEYRKAV